MNNKKIFTTCALLITALMGCSEESIDHTYTASSVDTPEVVYVGKSTGRHTIDSVYSTASAELTVKIEGVDENLAPEGSVALYGYGSSEGTTMNIRNSRIVTEELGIHAIRSLAFVTSGEEHTNALSYFYARDVRGGINLVGGSNLTNWTNATESANTNITLSALPAEINEGDSWFTLVPYSPINSANVGAGSYAFPTLLSVNATAPQSGEEGCYLFWYRQHYLWAGEYYVSSSYIYHKPGTGIVEAVYAIDYDANGQVAPTSGTSIAREQSGPGIMPEVTALDWIAFGQAIADGGSTATDKYDYIKIIDAADPSNPTGYDWVDVSVPATQGRNYKLHLAYPYVGYNANFNTLTDPVFTGTFAPVVQIDVNNDGIWDYVADNTSDLSIRTERPFGPFAANEPRNNSPIFISGGVRSTDGTGVALPTDPTARDLRDVYLHVYGFHDVVNNGAPYLHVSGLTDNSFADMHVGERVPVRMSIENIIDKDTAFDMKQYELIWATTEAGVAARENVVSYLDTDFARLDELLYRAYIPAQAVAGTIYFQLVIKTNPVPPVGSNQEALDTSTPVYSVNILDATSSAGVAPTPQVFVTPTSGSAPLEVEIQVGGSNDKDGVIDKFIYDFGNGDIDQDASRGGIYTYHADGEYPLTIYVVDNDGNTSSYTKTISVSSYGSIVIRNQHEVAITEFYLAEIADTAWGEDRLSGSLYPSASTAFSDILEGVYDYQVFLSDGRSVTGRLTVNGGEELVLEVDKFNIP